MLRTRIRRKTMRKLASLSQYTKARGQEHTRGIANHGIFGSERSDHSDSFSGVVRSQGCVTYVSPLHHYTMSNARSTRFHNSPISTLKHYIRQEGLEAASDGKLH